MKQFYLAHQLIMRHNVRKIQKELEYYYGITLINPFYDCERTDIDKLDTGESIDSLRFKLSMNECNEIVERDLYTISNCDGIVCFLFDIGAIGSYMEIFYANSLDLPVYLISPIEKIRNHPWIKSCCYKIFESVDDFKKYLEVNKKDMI